MTGQASANLLMNDIINGNGILVAPLLSTSNAPNVSRPVKFDARIDVQDGVIKGIKIYGDFLGLSDISTIEDQLLNVRYERSSLEACLQDLDLQQYFGELSIPELVNFLYG